MGVWRSSLAFAVLALVAIVNACGGDDEFKNCKNIECCSDDCAPNGAGGNEGGGGAGGGSSTLLSALVSYGDDGRQLGHSVAFDSEGNFYVVGYFDGAFDVGPASLASPVSDAMDLFLIKFDAGGHPVWARGFGQEHNSIHFYPSVAVAVGPDGHPVIAGPVLGTTTLGPSTMLTQSGPDPDLFVAKLDQADGAHIWNNHFAQSSTASSVRDIAIDANGYTYITGEIDGVAAQLPDGTTAGVNYALYVAKIDSMGMGVWSTLAEALSVGSFSSGVGVDAQGNVAIGGEFLAQLSVGAATIMTSGGQAPDAFVWTFDSDGVAQQSARWGDTVRQAIHDVDMDSQGNVLFAGEFSGTLALDTNELVATVVDGFIGKMAPDGAIIWAKHVAGANGVLVQRIAVGPDDSVAAIGNFTATFELDMVSTESKGNSDMFVFALSPDAELLWSRFPGGLGNQNGFGIDVAATGSVAFTGAMMGEVLEAGFALLNEGVGEDIIVGLIVPGDS